MVTQEPCENRGRKLAPFTTPVRTGAVVAATAGVVAPKEKNVMRGTTIHVEGRIVAAIRIQAATAGNAGTTSVGAVIEEVLLDITIHSFSLFRIRTSYISSDVSRAFPVR
jgi:hypothetical protein